MIGDSGGTFKYVVTKTSKMEKYWVYHNLEDTYYYLLEKIKLKGNMKLCIENCWNGMYWNTVISN